MAKSFFTAAGGIVLTALMMAFLLLQPVGAEPYRAGYMEGGSYWLFSESMEAVKQSLKAKGYGEKIVFPEDARFSPGWDREDLLENRAVALMEREDLDLIVSAGTDATRALLAANNGKAPIIGMAISDPVDAGFVDSLEDSGVDNFTVRLDPDRYRRMIEMFHQVVEFERLGLIYPDTASGRQYTNLREAEAVARARGFELLTYDRITTESAEDCLEGLRHLVEQGMDAFFIPSLLGFDWENSDVEMLFNYLNDKGVPTFARNGSRDVQAGALMGFSTVDFSRRGDFISNSIIHILAGEKPRNLNMVDRGTPKISFNLQAANTIGFNPPFDLLAATDELYQEIVLPENRKIR